MHKKSGHLITNITDVREQSNVQLLVNSLPMPETAASNPNHNVHHGVFCLSD